MRYLTVGNIISTLPLVCEIWFVKVDNWLIFDKVMNVWKLEAVGLLDSGILG